MGGGGLCFSRRTFHILSANSVVCSEWLDNSSCRQGGDFANGHLPGVLRDRAARGPSITRGDSCTPHPILGVRFRASSMQSKPVVPQ